MASVRLLFFLCVGALTVPAFADVPIVSGVAEGKRPGPYSSLVSVGTDRGKSHCFVCEAADRPIVIVFARKLDEPVGKLTQLLDKALSEHKKEELRAWVTFLNDDQAAFDPKVVDWSRKYGLRNVPVSVFEDVDGPPSYKLHKDAEVTVLLSVKQKVRKNFTFRDKELTNKKIDEVAKALSAMLSDVPK